MPVFPTLIVVGVDDSPGSRRALAAAQEIASATGSELHLVHVKLTKSPLRPKPVNPPVTQAASEEGTALLERLEREAAQGGVSVAATHLRAGDRVDRVLVDTQRELGAGLLVVGASSSGRIGRAVLGSPVTAVTRHASGSVLVVRT
jgi:nucleotide-binding universal stress UspA family protein